MNGLYPIIRRVRRPLVVLSNESATQVPARVENALAEGRDAEPSDQAADVGVANDVTVVMEPEKGEANDRSKKPRK